MKKTRITLISALLTLFTLSAARITFLCFTVPDNIYILEGEKYRFDKYALFDNLFSVTSPADTSGTLSREGLIDSEKNNYEARAEFVNIPIKTVNVHIVEKNHLIPCGTPIGIKLFAQGVEVLDTESFEASGNKMADPCAELVKKGDVITKINDKEIKSISDFSGSITSDDPVNLTVERKNKTHKITVTPQYDVNENKYRAGMIVRDSIAGIGTLTFINPQNHTFGALGHAIEDCDSEIIFPAKSGTAEEATVLSITKGRKGIPGEIHGMFTGKTIMGNIISNTDTGIFGTADKYDFFDRPALPVASISDTQKGDAKMLCTVSESTEEYDIVIEKILHMSPDSTKGMVIHITDPKLLSLTGGIIQGMSGSPIVQNGKLVGAVTHVFVNDPTRGYGIFIENMLAEAEKIK